MLRRVFYSFHYAADCWRLQQIINMGSIEGQRIVHSNEWETIERNPEGVKRWIDGQMIGKSCVVVLIGSHTATRPWVTYEICKAWNEGKGVLGVHIHGLLDRERRASFKGASPFASIPIAGTSWHLSDYVPLYDPPGWDSAEIYSSIKNNLGNWVEDAVRRRLQAA